MKTLTKYIILCIYLSFPLIGGFLYASESNQSSIYLISVGISDYKCIDALRLPQYDASAMANLYSKKNATKVYLLLNEKATKSKVLKLMETIFAQAKSNDMILFYFSGHGFSEGFCMYDTDCPGGGYITFNDLKKIYSKSKAKRKIIFADACFSGAFRTKPQNKQSVSAFKDKNIMLFLSSRTDESSLERSDMKNGYFTNFLLKALAGEADSNKDKVVTSQELFSYVSKKVAEISKDRQHPVMWGNFSNHFIVMKK